MMPAQERQNGVDRLGLGDQRENFHLPAAYLTDQRVFAIDLIDQVSPAPVLGFARDPVLLLPPLGRVSVFRGLQRSSAVTRMVSCSAAGHYDI